VAGTEKIKKAQVSEELKLLANLVVDVAVFGVQCTEVRFE
jgi:hypothetical protein